MAKSNGKPHFSFNVQSFEGDPQLLNFFFKQVEEISSLNSWSDSQTFAFCKSKLAGNALKFYISSEKAQQAQDIHELKTVLLEFFRPKTKQSALLELQAIQLLPNETYMNLNLRIDSLVRIVHPELGSKEAIDSVKSIHFLNTIDPNHKVKILEAALNSYDEVVARAQLLQDVSIQTSVLNPVSMPSSSNAFVPQNQNPMFDELSAQVNFLREDLKKMEQNSKCQINESPNSSRNNTANKRNFAQRSKFYKNRGHFNTLNSRSNIKCQYCGKVNHVLANCFRFKNFMSNRNDRHGSRNNNNNYSFRSRGSYLNANARSFRPRSTVYQNNNNDSGNQNNESQLN